MTDFFRQLFPQRVTRETIELLVACLGPLRHSELSMAIPQLDAGLLKNWRADDDRDPFYVRFTYFSEVSSRFEDPMGRYLRVSNIRVRDLDGDDEARVIIYFSRGLIMGFTLNRDANFRPDLGTIDVTNARVEYLDAPDAELEALIPPEERALINWSDVFEVELEGKTYYHLKDLGDGDFIGIDAGRRVYEIRHDPFEIKPLRGVLAEIFPRYQNEK
jgi:hypothetical protein